MTTATATKVKEGSKWDVRDLIAVMFQTDLPVLIWGEPGAGKTAFVQQLMALMGIPEENRVTLIGSMYEPQDIGGLPFRLEDCFDYLPPKWVRAVQPVLSGLFFDEINTAMLAMQAVMLRVVHEKKVGQQEFFGRIIAAANPPDVSAGGMELAPPLASRFAHVVFKLPTETWAHGMANGWPWTPPIVPHTYLDGVAEARALVGKFLVARPDLAEQRQEGVMPPASANFRTWDFLARFVASSLSVKMPRPLRLTGMSGIVGAGPAAEFEAFAKLGLNVSASDLVNVQTRQASFEKLAAEPPDVRAAVFAELTTMAPQAQLTGSGRVNLAAVFSDALTSQLPRDEVATAWSAAAAHFPVETRRAMAAALASTMNPEVRA